MRDTITLIIAPYHVGKPDHRVGAGPKHILSKNLVPRLSALCKTVNVQTITAVSDFEGEIGRSFEILRLISQAVSHCVAEGSFPIILAGNCNAEIGVAAGLNHSRNPEVRDMIWFDAHSDFDAPDETMSGYFDGMGVSMLSGESWKALMATVPGHQPLMMNRFTFVGVRDVSGAQRRKLDETEARVIYGGKERSEKDYPCELDRLLADGDGRECSVHVDLDCLDTEIGMANEYAAPGGSSEEGLKGCLEVVRRKRVPVSLTVASFNPGLEGGERIADVAVNAIIDFAKIVLN